jgi:hypothetical protein
MRQPFKRTAIVIDNWTAVRAKRAHIHLHPCDKDGVLNWNGTNEAQEGHAAGGEEAFAYASTALPQRVCNYCTVGDGWNLGSQ